MPVLQLRIEICRPLREWSPASRACIALALQICRLRKFADPDVAVADRFALISMGLELDGRAIVGLVERFADVERLPLKLEVVVNQHAIPENGRISGRFE